MNSDRFVRLVLRGLPALLIVASLAELIAAIAAWGAAAHVEIPAWETTFAGFAFGLPGLIVGVLVLRDVARKTAAPFQVFYLQLAAGFFALLLAIGGETALAFTIADPSTYDSIREPDGTLNTSPTGFIFIALMMTLFVSFYVVIVSYLFAQSITAEPRTSFDRRENEPDGVGELLSGKPRPQESRPRW